MIICLIETELQSEKKAGNFSRFVERHTSKALLLFESELKSDYTFFIERVFARDVDAAVQACLENYEKVAQFVEKNMAAEACA